MEPGSGPSAARAHTPRSAWPGLWVQGHFQAEGQGFQGQARKQLLPWGTEQDAWLRREQSRAEDNP